MTGTYTENRLHIPDGRVDCFSPRRGLTIEVEVMGAVDTPKHRIITTRFVQGIVIFVAEVGDALQHQYELMAAERNRR